MKTIFKSLVSLGFLLLMTYFPTYSQVGINTDNSQPDPSAMLDIKSNNKGFLPPRVALSSINSPDPISTPANGLLIYNTSIVGTPPNNVTVGYYYWNGIQWVSLTTPSAQDSINNPFKYSAGNTFQRAGGYVFINHDLVLDSLRLFIKPYKSSIYFGGYPAGLTTGCNNVTLGYICGQSLTSGFGNILIGESVANYATTAYDNVIIGTHAGVSIVSGKENTIVGPGAGYNITGNGNTALGQHALLHSQSSYLTALGEGALQENLTGAANTSIGTWSTFNNKTGSNNTVVGYNALFNDTTGGSNTVIGAYAQEHGNGSYNISIGDYALQNATTASSNISIGRFTMSNATTATSNATIGGLNEITTGGYNTAIGINSLSHLTGGSDNTAIGIGSLNNLTTGIRNIGLGEGAGYNITTGNYNIALGFYQNVPVDTGNYQLVIGSGGDSTNTAIYWDMLKSWGRWNGTLFLKTIPTIPMPSTILVPGVNGVISQANLMVGNDSTWIDNGLIANKQISLRDTVKMKMEVATSGIISPNLTLSTSDTIEAVLGKSVFISADSSYYDCRSVISVHKWWKRKYE